MASDEVRVRYYPGRTAQEAGLAFEADARMAAQHGYEASSRAWDGQQLKVVYQPVGAGSRSRPRRRVGAIVSLLGAGVMAIGVFLPWVTLENAFESLSVNGLDNFLNGNSGAIDGILVLIAAGVLALAGLRGRAILAGVAALIGLVIGFLNLRTIQEQIDLELTDDGFFSIQGDVGIGVWLVMIGGVIGLTGAVLSIRRDRT